MFFSRIQRNQCSLILFGRTSAKVFLIIFAVGWILIENKWINSSISLEPILFFIDVPIIIGLEFLHRQRCSSNSKQKFGSIDFSNPRNQNNRKSLLKKAQNVWVVDYFQNTINLRKVNAPDQLAHNAQIGTRSQEDLHIPRQKPIVDLFHDSGNALLILGRPGAGKTFTLAELARGLIAEARQDKAAAIPLVLSLNSWRKELDFMEWLATQLNLQYQCSLQQARHWISNGHIALLLDDLDKVAETERRPCVEAINSFGELHKVDLALCCRAEEYEVLAPTKLNLGKAIRLLPLKEYQITRYLKRVGSNAKPLLSAINKDHSMMTLARIPLFLNIMALVYQDLPLSRSRLQPLKNVRTHRQHLFDAYIRQQFSILKNEDGILIGKKALHWLVWLAGRMQDINETEFYLERLQAHWLPDKKIHQNHSRKVGLVIGLAIGLSVGLAIGLAVRLAFGSASGGIAGVVAGVVTGLTVGLAGGVTFGLKSYRSKIDMADELVWIWPNRSEIVIALTFALVFGLGIRLGIELVAWKLVVGWIGGLVGGIAYGLVGGLMGGLAGGLSGGLSGGLIGGFVSKLKGGLAGSLAGGLAGGLVFGLAAIFSTGLKSLDIGVRSEPGAGLGRSRQTAFRSFVANGLIGGLTVGLAVGIAGAWAKDWLWGLTFGLVFGPTSGFALAIIAFIKDGGNAYINYWFLRRTLAAKNYLPYELGIFLETMAHINILQRKGSGYRFAHLTLQEHIAKLDPETFQLD